MKGTIDITNSYSDISKINDTKNVSLTQILVKISVI